MARILFAALLLAEINWSCNQSPACESESGCDETSESAGESETGESETETDMPDMPDMPDMGG
ncbi:hypothetical protein ACNOYE_31590 [Nannocystaceae bacterium ST9]